MDTITSVNNPKIKQLVRLRQQKREREELGKFLIEGYRELSRALEGGHPIEFLYICPSFFLGENEWALIDKIKGQGGVVISCGETVFEKISYRDRPDGLIGVAPHLHVALDELSLASTPLIVVAEAIEKPGNLGTILRSTDAVGGTGLIVCDECTDVHNPNVVRASVGTLFTVPVVRETSERTLLWLKKQQICVVAATPHAKHLFTETDLSGPVAIVVGTEQLGLSDRWMKEADIQVRIPMRGVADSLNVATATTLLLYEVQRQRYSNPL